MKIRDVGVIGAGQMGSGIAHVCALGGYDVALNDVTRDKIDEALELIGHNLARQVKSGRIDEKQREAALGRIRPAETLQDLAQCDLVIETATEDEAIKRKILGELCKVLKKEALIATNTSSISVTRLAAATDRPEMFIGIHFMLPAPLMELVELIRGIATGDETFGIAREFALSLDKKVAVAEDFPAFIVNRILLPMINEAVYTLYEGVGSVEAIDTAMKLGAHHPMGPLELADFIGLDTCLSIMQVLYEGLADSKYRPCPLLVKYVEAGWLGRKASRGFYDYRGESMRLAAITAWVRLSTLSFARMADTWALTVASETPRLKAICLLSSPSRSIISTRTCCGVSVVSRRASSASSPSPGVSRSSPGGHQTSPPSTAATAACMSSTGLDLEMKPDAPSSSARRITAGSSLAETTTIGTPGYCARM
jgi:3-hydroxybutyryl-CoA dehydrogenase